MSAVFATAARHIRLVSSCRGPLQVMSGKRNETPEQRAERKQAQKAAKAAKRAQREGRLPEGQPDLGRKPCDLCSENKDLLIRCQIDETGKWHMVCGRCWKGVSGGVVDGDVQHPHYRYGGLWKNLKKP